jgi:CheY-like chemotaxis protein
MRAFKLNKEGLPESIADRLVYLRRKAKINIDYVANRFNVNKSTVSRWEASTFWDNIGESTFKREILLKLAELYQGDYYWLLHGRKFNERQSNIILIIDDDKTSSSILSMIIKSTFGGKFSEVSFTNGIDALEWAQNNSAAAVICDYRMPDINGDKIIRRLREIPEYASIPIYAITVYDEQDIIQLLIDSGAEKVLVKPVKDREIFKLLNHI